MSALSRRTLVEIGLYGLVAVVGGLVLAAVLEIVYLIFMVTEGAEVQGALVQTLPVAGVIEPLTTKLLPALFVVYMARSQAPASRGLFHRRWLLAGLSVGLAIGLLEFLLKLPALTSGGPSLIVCALPAAALLHPLMGLLAASPAFRLVDGDYEGRRRLAWIGIVLVTLALAMGIHYWWNTAGLEVVRGALPGSCV